MKYIAHRGYSSKAPENTVPAFTLAGEKQRFYGIECDLYTTKDGKFVVFHDENLKRMTGIDGLIMDYSLDEITQMNIIKGSKIKQYPNLKIPTFEEFIDICTYYDKTAVIEIKKIHDITQLNDLIEIIDQHPGLKAVIISFNINYLKYIRALSNCELQLLTDLVDDEIIYECRVNQLDLSMPKEMISKDLVKKLKKEGFKIGTFTVDDTKMAIEFERLKIDYLTTNKL
ncbi:MAG: glycerophosphodiester phosphodiesterase family protein [Acholeplasmataceae bacterium]|jgi:glycerophosphoryl diester phosphodiesterase|nr:glycerophosphodiester phosphodiesterase family protein [Acholeplasmataceae bacterium]MDD4193700.1 glycerophosphodiester phosphodiesterase family protein [Acholeplasmataceae bacterium]